MMQQHNQQPLNPAVNPSVLAANPQLAQYATYQSATGQLHGNPAGANLIPTLANSGLVKKYFHKKNFTLLKIKGLFNTSAKSKWAANHFADDCWSTHQFRTARCIFRSICTYASSWTRLEFVARSSSGYRQWSACSATKN